MSRKTLEHMEAMGMVNTPLLNPVPTKREYFWLFVFVIVENLIALGIEVLFLSPVSCSTSAHIVLQLGNGGVMTSQGHYYSWDIRLFTLALSLFFLICYYKK